MASNRIVNATRDFPPFSLFLKSYHRGGNTRVSWVELTEFVYNGVVVKFQRAGEFGTSQVIVTVSVCNYFDLINCFTIQRLTSLDDLTAACDL